MVTYLSIIGRLLKGLEVPVLLVGSGRGGRVYNCLPLWPRGHSKLYPPPQVCCVEEGFPLWCLYVRRASGSGGVVRVSLIEKKVR